MRNTIVTGIGFAALLALAACGGNKIPPAGTDWGQGMCEDAFHSDFDQQRMLNIDDTADNNTFRAGCKDCETSDPNQCGFWQADPIHCGQLAYANGVWTPADFTLPVDLFRDEQGNEQLDECEGPQFMAPLGGQTPDGDYQFIVDRFAVNGGGSRAAVATG
jgi:hypothetical protein